MFPLAVVNQASYADPSLTIALLHLNGANNSTAFPDSSPNNITFFQAYGNNVISTAQAKFNGSSLFIGTDPGSGIVSANNTLFNLTNKNWTLEGFFRPSSISAQTRAYIGFGGRHGIFATNGIVKAQVLVGSTTYEITHQNDITALVWTHLALVRDNDKIYLYVDGVKSSTYISVGTSSLTNTENKMAITMPNFWNGSSYGQVGGFGGYAAECRLRQEIVYTSDFTPPSTPFTY